MSTNHGHDYEEHIYTNCMLYNPYPYEIPARYDENRVQPLIDNQSLYHMCVIRAEIDSGVIPLYIHQDNGLAYNNGSYVSQYRICISYGAFNGIAYVKYISEKANDTNASNRYVYSINHFVKLVNTAFSEAFASLLAQTVLTSAVPPYLYYDESTTMFTIVADKVYSNNIHVFMNSKLWGMFANFEYLQNSVTDPNGKDYEIVIRNRYNNSSTTQFDPLIHTNVPCYLMRGEYVVDNVKDLDKIILTTSSISVSNEYVPQISISDGSVGIDSSMSIITDFLTNEDSRTSMGHPLYLYLPTIYRYIDLVNTNPLSRIDINLYWQARNGVIKELMMPPYSTMSVKLMFTKK